MKNYTLFVSMLSFLLLSCALTGAGAGSATQTLKRLDRSDDIFKSLKQRLQFERQEKARQKHQRKMTEAREEKKTKPRASVAQRKIIAKKAKRKQKRPASRDVIAEHASAASQEKQEQKAQGKPTPATPPPPKSGELDSAILTARERQHKEESDAKAAAMRMRDHVERREGEPPSEQHIEGEDSIEFEPGMPVKNKEGKEEKKDAAAGAELLRPYVHPKSDERLRKEREAIAFLSIYGPRVPNITTFRTYVLWKSGRTLPNDFYWLLVTELALARTGGRLPKPLYEKLKTDGSCNWFKDDFSGYNEAERALRNLIKREMLNFRLGKSIVAIKEATRSHPELSVVLTSLRDMGTELKDASLYARWIIARKKLIALQKSDGGTIPITPEISSLGNFRIIYS